MFQEETAEPRAKEIEVRHGWPPERHTARSVLTRAAGVRGSSSDRLAWPRHSRAQGTSTSGATASARPPPLDTTRSSDAPQSCGAYFVHEISGIISRPELC